MALGCLPGYAPPLLSFVEIDDNFSCATKRSVQTMRWKTPEFVSAPARHNTERRKRALALFRVLRFAPINLQTDCAAMRQRQGKYLQLKNLRRGLIIEFWLHHSKNATQRAVFKSDCKPSMYQEEYRGWAGYWTLSTPPPLPPRCHYLRKKCRQAKKAGARSSRFALCGKTLGESSRTTAMDGSAPQLARKKPRSHINTRK